MHKILTARYYWFVILAIVIAVYGCAGDSNDDDDSDDVPNGSRSIFSPADLLPGEDDISSWKNLAAYEEANDFDDLYSFINGGAEVFIENGFVSGVFQIYNHCVGDVCDFRVVHVRIYDQDNADNARAVYDKVATGIGTPWNGAGTEARIDESGLATLTVEFWQRNFFVQVIIEEKSNEGLNVAKLFAAHISEQIG